MIAVWLLLSATFAKAQTTTITGELKDSLTRESEPYATVRVYKSRGKNDKPLAMSVTDVDGKFEQKVTGQGRYYIVFSSMGRKEIVRRVELGNAPTLNLGTLLVQDDAKALEGVEVVAQKPLVKMETDKMSYDVQNDVDANTNTVLDMLRKVPMVTVDGQDNITVNGQNSFKVYVDGKPNVMFSASPSQIFKSMPASAVKSIEVITNPGAKYDAEGTGGVLNIVMNRASGQQKKMNGYNGNISVTGSNNGWRGGAFLSGQQGKLTYSANVMYNNGRNNGTETSIMRTGTDGSVMDYYQKGNTRMHFTMANLSLAYELDSMSNVSASLGLTDFNMKNDGHPTTSFSGGIYGQGFSYGNAMTMENAHSSFNGSIDYQRFLNRERTSSITLSYLFTASPQHDRNRRTYDPLPPEVTIPLTDLYSDASGRGTEHTVQADYTTPLSKSQTFNAGAKFIARRNSSDSKFYNVVSGEELYNAGNSVDYKNSQSILAAYSEYSATLGKLGAKAGLRYEHTWENVEFVLGAGENFKKHYGTLVPSASFTYNIAAATNLGINYNMRISRPGIGYLNPYIDRSNPTALSYGNPDLAVEKSHNVSLVFNTFTPKFMMNLTLGENFANNQIEQYSFLKDGTLNTTYGNIVRSRWTNFNTFMNYALTAKTRLMMNASFDYGDIRSDRLGERNHGWQANVFFGWQQTLPWDLKWSCFMGGMTKRYNLQGHTGGFNFFTTTLAKSFFNDRLDISLQFMSPFTGKMEMKQYSRGADFTQATKTTIRLHNIGLTVKWSFGNTKKQFQTHESKISNDFQEKKSGSQQMNGMGVGGTSIGMYRKPAERHPHNESAVFV